MTVAIAVLCIVFTSFVLFCFAVTLLGNAHRQFQKKNAKQNKLAAICQR